MTQSCGSASEARAAGCQGYAQVREETVAVWTGGACARGGMSAVAQAGGGGRKGVEVAGSTVVRRALPKGAAHGVG